MKDDALYRIRRLLLVGAERLDERGFEKLRTGLDAGDQPGLATSDSRDLAFRGNAGRPPRTALSPANAVRFPLGPGALGGARTDDA